jgi:hypothetical protein
MAHILIYSLLHTFILLRIYVCIDKCTSMVINVYIYTCEENYYELMLFSKCDMEEMRDPVMIHR